VESFWRKCSTCKKEIPFNTFYSVCSVSTCRTHSTNYVFCSLPCWDTHVPIERHRGDTAAAIEKRSPKTAEEERPEADKKRILVPSASASEDDILVVASKVKKYVLEKSGLSTSAGVYDALSQRIRRICDRAIEEAKRQNRKTLMDRDIP